MDIGLIFGLVKVALEVWKDERKDRFEKKRANLERDYYEELKRPEHERSQLYLDNILLELDILAKTVLPESVRD